MTKVKTIIDRAKKYYFDEWRGNEKISPAFGEKVYLTNLGWNHIVHKQRPLVDMIIRLKKLKLARELLESATTYQTVQRKGKYYFYGLQSVKGDTRVKVVVTSRGKRGKKVLYSVMFKNVSRQKQKEIEKHNKKIIAEFKRKYPRRRKSRRKR